MSAKYCACIWSPRHEHSPISSSAVYTSLVPHVESRCNPLLNQEGQREWSARLVVVQLVCVSFVTNLSQRFMYGVKVVVTEDIWSALCNGLEAVIRNRREKYAPLVAVSN